MKKALCEILAASALVLSVQPVTFAELNNTKQEVIYINQEVKDLDKLFKKALKGETVLDETPFQVNADLKNDKTKEKAKVKTYTTTQRLKAVKHEDDTVEETYATTSFALVPKDKSGLITTQGSYGTTGSLYNSGYDPESISVKAYSTIYWTNYTASNGGKYYDLTRVTGGWSSEDSHVTVSNKVAGLRASGYTENNAYKPQGADYSVSGWTFDQPAPS